MTDEWLSLSNAAKLPGVHPNTLRLWSDKGMLPVHLTHGGHRRYRRDQVLLWADANQKSRVIESDAMLQEVIKNVRMQISEGHLQAEAWYQKLDEDARIQYRMSARSLFQGLMTYICMSLGRLFRHIVPTLAPALKCMCVLRERTARNDNKKTRSKQCKISRTIFPSLPPSSQSVSRRFYIVTGSADPKPNISCGGRLASSASASAR